MISENVNPEEHEAVSLKIAYINDLNNNELLLCFSQGSTYVFFDFENDGYCKVSSHDAIRSNGNKRFAKPTRAKILGSNVGAVVFANQIILGTPLEFMYYDLKKDKFRNLTTTKIKEIVLDIE